MEGITAGHVAKKLRFGAFLAFCSSGTNPQKPPRNLTERRFRSYWERTTGSNERQRFGEVRSSVGVRRFRQ